MRRLMAALFALTLVVSLAPSVADAARLGGGRSLGAQRAPVQRQVTVPQQARPATPVSQPAGGSRWFGPLAGLAAGLGLGWLFSQGGFGPMVGTLAMALIAGFVLLSLLRLLGQRSERSSAESSSFQYAGLGNETDAAPPPSQRPFSGAPPERAGVPGPADFDVEAFLKQSKRNFVQLQEANDRADLAELREVTTDEMFETLRGDISSRGARQQQTEIIMLDASLLEVATEGSMHWASVRFFGSVRESPRAAPEPFEEVWNLCKPVDGLSGWLLAGIQQVS